MAVLKKEEYLETVKKLVGEDASDETLAVIQNLTDTYNDMETRTGTENWKQKYEENDKEWRKKYKDAFFNGTSNQPRKDDSNIDNAYEKITINSLFE
jgi:sortase (surface protein transpeptidase)